MREVLGWSAAETAEAAGHVGRGRQQRFAARPCDARRGNERGGAGAEPTGEERALLDRYIDVHERADASAVAALVAEDIRITMPPHPWLFEGLEAIRPLIEEGLTEAGEWRVVPTAANRMPTAACYLRAPGDTEFRAFKFDVLRIEAGRIMEITTFDAKLFDAFGLPATLPP